MKYLKDSNNQIFAFESDGSQDDFIGKNLTPITKAQADTIIAANQPAPTQVKVITRRQGRLALRRANKLLIVESAINNIADDDARIDAQIEYEADTWELDNPFLQSMWNQLGGTESELNNLFTLAKTL